MQRWSVKVWLIAIALLGASSVQAASPVYADPTLEHMYDILFANGYIDPTDQQQLIDYVRIKDCNLLQKYYGNDFAWNKIQTRIAGEAKTLQKDIATHFKIDDRLQIDRYNFKTQSFDINQRSRLDNINQMSLLSAQYFYCNGVQMNTSGQVIPLMFAFKPDVPLSLRRIPMAEAMARRILPDIIETTDSMQMRFIYVTYYFTIDGIQDISKSQAVFGGHMDKIEFFTDADHTQRIKTLVYNSY